MWYWCENRYHYDRPGDLEIVIAFNNWIIRNHWEESTLKDPCTSRNLECSIIAFQISGERMTTLIINIRKSHIFGRNYRNTKKYRKSFLEYWFGSIFPGCDINAKVHKGKGWHTCVDYTHTHTHTDPEKENEFGKNVSNIPKNT